MRLWGKTRDALVCSESRRNRAEDKGERNGSLAPGFRRGGSEGERGDSRGVYREFRSEERRRAWVKGLRVGESAGGVGQGRWGRE